MKVTDTYTGITEYENDFYISNEDYLDYCYLAHLLVISGCVLNYYEKSLFSLLSWKF